MYSTCSLSPFENEAVVAEILNRARGKLVLINAHGALPGLRSRPGVITWKVGGGAMYTHRHTHTSTRTHTCRFSTMT